MIRVFHLIKGLGRGGAETLLSEGLRHADRKRFTYGYGYFLPWKDALVGELKRSGAPVYLFRSKNAGGMLLHSRKIAQLLKTQKADILHCHLPMAGVVGRLAGKLAGIPVVYTEHNLLERYHWLTRRANLHTWGMQHQVIAVSEEVAGSIQHHAPHSVPVRVVRNGVDVDKFRPTGSGGRDVRRLWGIPPDAAVVGTVAVFTAKKKLDDWIRAAAVIHRAHPGAYFLIAGDGPLRDELRQSAAKTELGKKILFLGLQDKVEACLDAMNLYMMSSRFEGLPIALLEAMAMELPVVATRVGGIPEVVMEGKTGSLVEPGDIAGLAGAAAGLLSDPKQRAAMGKAGRRIVEDRFGMQRMVHALEGIYIEIAARSSAAKTPGANRP